MKFSISLASLVLAVGVSSPAHAIYEATETSANATASCQASLPVYDTQLRKRPLAVNNEGTTNTFVACSFSTQQDADDIQAIGYFGVFLINQTATEQTVTCTGVAGYASQGADTFYLGKTVVLPANGEGEMFFDINDNGGEGYYPLANLQCNLPAGTGIGDTYVGFDLDDAP